MSKTLTFLTLFLGITFITYSQESEVSKLINTKYSKSPATILLNYGWPKQRPDFYTPYRINGLQVISVNRPGTGMDDIYLLNKQGKTEFRTIRPTSPINIPNDHRPKRDSFNPHGAASFAEALFAGLFRSIQ